MILNIFFLLNNSIYNYYLFTVLGSGNTSSSNESVASDSQLLTQDLPVKHKRGGAMMGMHYPSGYTQRSNPAISV